MQRSKSFEERFQASATEVFASFPSALELVGDENAYRFDRKAPPIDESDEFLEGEDDEYDGYHDMDNFDDMQVRMGFSHFDCEDHQSSANTVVSFTKTPAI